MYCKECGEKLLFGTRFCKSCGKNQPEMSTVLGASNVNINDNQEELAPNEKVDIVEQTKLLKKHKIFYCNREVLIDTLGSGFISSLFVQGNFSKSVLFCSDKRVYLRGKLFERNIQGKITYFNGEQSIDLREITGIKYYIDDPIHRFKIIAPLFILGILGLIIAPEQRGDLKAIISMVSGALLGLGVVSLFIYNLKKAKWFVIEYAGGNLMTNCNWYARKSIRRFMKNISIQKDNLFK